MRRLRLVVALIALVACSKPPPGEIDPTPFRDASWGMSPIQVRARESSNQVIEVTDERALYADRVIGMVVVVTYEFADGRLVAGGYEVREEHEDAQGHVEDYLRFQKALTEEYGEPRDDDEDGTIWFNPLYENDYIKWGFALTSGHVIFRTVWETPDTIVELSLGRPGVALAARVGYTNKAWAATEDGRRRRRASEAL